MLMSFIQTYSITVRDINYGQHMDHLALLNYLHETRVRYLTSIGASEINIDGLNTGLVVSELKCKYIKECFYGDKIDIKIHTEQLTTTRLNFIYEVTRAGIVIAKATITTAFISSQHKVVPIPINLLSKHD